MQAILIDGPGTAADLYIGTAPDPAPGPGQVLLHTVAAGVNRADLLQRAGKYPPPAGASTILGLEVAGTVIGLGTGVTDYEIGDNVCALVSGGGYAQQIAVDQEMLLPLPAGMSFTKAAAVPETFLTAYQALHWIGGLRTGQRVLVHAAASGVGTAALQLIRLAGAHAIATASAGKQEVCLRLGAERCIDYRSENFAAAVADATDGRGVDLILDFVGADYWEKNLSSLAPDGKLVLLGLLGGHEVKGFSLATLLQRRLTVQATTLRSRDREYQHRLTADFRRDCLPHFATRDLEPVVDTIYDWNQVDAAHRHLESNETRGKLVLTIGDETEADWL